MKTTYKLALAVAAGVLIGMGARAIHAQAAHAQATQADPPPAQSIPVQTAKAPPAYVIAEVEVTDPETLKKYGEKAPQIVASFGGHYVVRGGKVQSLEGDAPKEFVVVIGFESMEKAREWYDSPAYAAIRGFRQSATKSRIFIAEGVAPQ